MTKALFAGALTLAALLTSALPMAVYAAKGAVRPLADARAYLRRPPWRNRVRERAPTYHVRALLGQNNDYPVVR